MSRPALEVADIFRGHGPAWRQANAGHVSLGQLKVMSAIESCRTAALGGHVARCENENCGHTQIAYNSCRNPPGTTMCTCGWWVSAEPHVCSTDMKPKGVSFKYKDYRIEGPGRCKTMTLETDEFIRRFLTHVLPKGFHRIRHYGLLANGNRAANIAHARKLLAVPSRPKEPEMPEAALDEPRVLPRPCPCCGGRMIIIETFPRGCEPKHRPTPAPAAIRIDTS
jgi:hypothetical protein